MEQQEYKPAHIWDPGTCKTRTSAIRLLHGALYVFKDFIGVRWNLMSFFFLIKFLISVFEIEEEGEDKLSSSCAASVPKFLQQLGLGQSEARNVELFPGVFCR